MKPKVQVVRLKLAREMAWEDAMQDSLFWWRKSDVGGWRLLYVPGTAYCTEGYAAYTLAEVDELLPSHVMERDMKYYLHITKTQKTEHFRLPDYYIAYVDISGSRYLRSERDDKAVDAHAKMWLYLKKEGLIE